MSAFVCPSNTEIKQSNNTSNQTRKSIDYQDSISRTLSTGVKRIQDEGVSNIDRKLFTFKPKLNPKTKLLTSKILSFYERQNLHSKKQLETVIKQ